MFCDETFCITHDSLALASMAQDYAKRFSLNYLSPEITRPASYLYLDEAGLCLKQEEADFRLDLTKGKAAYRREHSSWRSELLAKACGVKAGYRPQIVDLSAGLGSDASLLAALGCSVTCVERSPIMVALLSDALSRLEEPLPITLIFAEAHVYLDALEIKPDVIYFDPMHPERKKSASVKKAMKLVRQYVGDDMDAHTVAALALTKAAKRLVIKRPRLAEALIDKKADVVFTGRSTRFDVYLTGF